jgi:hypothetical protein
MERGIPPPEERFLSFIPFNRTDEVWGKGNVSPVGALAFAFDD